MVHSQQQQVLLFFKLDKSKAKERAARQIKRPFRFVVRHSLRFRLALRLRQATQVNYFDFPWLRLFDHLHRFAIDAVKRGAQTFMTTDEFIQAALESKKIEWTTEVMDVRNVVDSGVGFQLVQEPQSLLRERERKLICLPALRQDDCAREIQTSSLQISFQKLALLDRKPGNLFGNVAHDAPSSKTLISLTDN